MAEAGTLTLAFVSTHPREAASVLEGLAASDAAALFASLPARAAAPALEAMSPQSAARIVVALDDPHGLGLLTAVGVQSAVAVLRHVREPRRTALIEGLSTTTALASRLLLGYSEETVGAWTDPEAMALAPNTTVGDALARVRGDTDLAANEIYVVGEGQKLLGVVSLRLLLSVPETSALTGLMHAPGGSVSAAMPLSGAAAHAGWKLTSQLPVVERGNRFIGVLYAAKLAEALARVGHPGADASASSLSGLVARSYWNTVSGLLQVGLGALPPARSILPEDQ